jgi:hypothetical protein
MTKPQCYHNVPKQCEKKPRYYIKVKDDFYHEHYDPGSLQYLGACKEHWDMLLNLDGTLDSVYIKLTKKEYETGQLLDE